MSQYTLLYSYVLLLVRKLRNSLMIMSLDIFSLLILIINIQIFINDILFSEDLILNLTLPKRAINKKFFFLNFLNYSELFIRKYG